MSERIPEQEDFGLIFIDPAVQRSLDQQREFQAELDVSPDIPQERVQEMIQILDQGWMHLKEYVRVTGLLDTPPVEVVQVEDEGGIRPLFVPPDFTNVAETGVRHAVNDQPFVSRGFTADRSRFIVDGHDLGARHVLRLIFSRVVSVHVPGRSGPLRAEWFSHANAEDVSMDFTYDSPEYASMKSHAYFADYTARVEAAIKPEQRIAERIMTVRDIPIPDDGHVTEDEILALQTHVNELLGISDDGMPHLAVLQAGSPIFGGHPGRPLEVEGYMAQQATHILVVNAASLVPKVEVIRTEDSITSFPVKDALELRLLVQFIGSEPGTDSGEVMVRLRDVKHLNSVRQAVYDEAGTEIVDDTKN